MQRKTFKLFAGKNPPPYLCTPQKGSLAQLAVVFQSDGRSFRKTRSRERSEAGFRIKKGV